MSKIGQRLDLWLEVLKDPKELFARERKKANYDEAHKHLLMGALAFSFLYGATFKIMPGVSPQTKPFDLPTFILFVLVSAAIAFLGVVLLFALNYYFSKVLGGKGKFPEQYYLSSVVLAPLLLLYYVSKLFPGVGWMIGAGVLLYFAYANIQMLKEVHRFSTVKALLAFFGTSALVLAAWWLAGLTKYIPNV